MSKVKIVSFFGTEMQQQAIDLKNKMMRISITKTDLMLKGNN
jgi:hypothetical protein